MLWKRHIFVTNRCNIQTSRKKLKTKTEKHFFQLGLHLGYPPKIYNDNKLITLSRLRCGSDKNGVQKMKMVKQPIFSSQFKLSKPK